MAMLVSGPNRKGAAHDTLRARYLLCMYTALVSKRNAASEPLVCFMHARRTLVKKRQCDLGSRIYAGGMQLGVMVSD